MDTSTVLGGLLVCLLGIMLVFLIRSLLAMYERMFKNGTSKPTIPEEMLNSFAEVLNQELKKYDDRWRKRVVNEKTPENPPTPVSPEQPASAFEKGVEQMFEQIAKKGGE